MGLVERIEEDIKKLMVARDSSRLEVVRFLKSALKYSAIEKKVDRLSDADAYLVIQKQIKQRKESADQFMAAGRTDLAQNESNQLTILETYLPKQLDDAALESAILGELQSQGATSKKDFGRIMKILTEKLSGQVDARRLSDFLNRHLK